MAKTKRSVSRTKSAAPKTEDKPQVGPQSVQYIVEHLVTDADVNRNPEADLVAGETIAIQMIAREAAIAAGIDVDKVEADFAEKNDGEIMLFGNDELNLDASSDAPKESFKLTLDANGETFESEAGNIEDAIMGLRVGRMVTKGTITLEHAGRVAVRMVFPKHLRRPLVNRDAATFLGKQLKTILREPVAVGALTEVLQHVASNPALLNNPTTGTEANATE